MGRIEAFSASWRDSKRLILPQKLKIWTMLFIHLFPPPTQFSIKWTHSNLVTIFLLLEHACNHWLNLGGNHQLDWPPLNLPFHLDNGGPWPVPQMVVDIRSRCCPSWPSILHNGPLWTLSATHLGSKTDSFALKISPTGRKASERPRAPW